MKTKNYWIVGLLAILMTGCPRMKDKPDAFGNFESDEITISAEANGKLMQFNLEEGQKLKQGQYIGYVDTINLHISKKQLRQSKKAILSRIENIEAQIQLQKQILDNILIQQDRVHKLFASAAATQQQVDDVDGQVDAAKKQISAIKTQKQSVLDEAAAMDQQIAQIEENIRKSVIVNPINGIVLAKYAYENEVTGFGKPLYKIADMDVVKLKAFVSGAQLPSVKIGQKARISFDKEDLNLQSVEGDVCWIADQAEFTPKVIQTREERVNLVYAIKIRVKNDGAIKIGMPGEVNFIQ